MWMFGVEFGGTQFAVFDILPRPPRELPQCLERLFGSTRLICIHHCQNRIPKARQSPP
jgi:hypothetical protein